MALCCTQFVTKDQASLNLLDEFDVLCSVPCEANKLHHIIFVNRHSVFFCKFWHTCAVINFLSPAYLVFFVKSKTSCVNVPFTAVELLCHEIPDSIVAPNLWPPNNPDPIMLWITESWPCYRSGSVSSLCEMPIS